MAIDPIRAALDAVVNAGHAAGLWAARRPADQAERRGASERAAQARATRTPKEER